MKTPISIKALCLFLPLLLSVACLAQDNLTFTDFSQMKGKVVDSRGKPIEKFEVKIQILDYSKGGFNKPPEKVEAWKGEFTDGVFEFEVEKPYPAEEKTYLSFKVSANGYIASNEDWRLLRDIDGDFGTTKMDQGMTVKGKLVLPNSSREERIVGPLVVVRKEQKSSFLMPNYNDRFSQRVTVQDDGSFQTVVPENCKLWLKASADNAAGTRQPFKIRKVESKDDVQDLGEIALKPGTAVSGTVLSNDGEPVEGQVVCIERDIPNSQGINEVIYGYAVSGPDGRFTLPPRVGACEIRLADSGTVAGKRVKAEGKMLKARTIDIQLKAGKAVPDLEIREEQTWKISGTVRFDREATGEPVLYATVGGNQTQVKLDANGGFEFEAIDGLGCYLLIYNTGNSTADFYMTRLTTESLRANREHFTGSPANQAQYFTFKEVSSDIGPLDFEMVKYQPDQRTFTEAIFDWLIYGD